jgi:hypothetical protein
MKRNNQIDLQELLGYILLFTAIHLVYRLLLVPFSECRDLMEDIHSDVSQNVHSDLSQDVHSGLSQDVHSDHSKGVHSDLSQATGRHSDLSGINSKEDAVNISAVLTKTCLRFAKYLMNELPNDCSKRKAMAVSMYK